MGWAFIGPFLAVFAFALVVPVGYAIYLSLFRQQLLGGNTFTGLALAAANGVLPGWSYLPYEVYANNIFPDTVGQAYTGKSSLSTGLQAWQQQLASYGNQQGFTVTSG
jgi:ABC-type sugar transport system permease subunit